MRSRMAGCRRLANENTALEEPDVFYFGNAIGDSGNSAADASVNAQDIGGARDNPHNFLSRALVDDAFDYNRDSLVNAQDIGIARDNPTNFLSDLNLITVPAAAPVAAGAASVPNSDASGVLPVPLKDLASTQVVVDSPLQPVRGDSPLGNHQSQLVDDVYRRLDGADRTDPGSEEVEPRDWSLPLLLDDLVDLLGEESWSWGR